MALPILPDLYGKVEQKIDTFTFRNEGAIKIPKEKREIAYKQAVDIFIDSIDFNLYQNNKSAPPLQFYGYATLVFEDAISQSIPLIFPRQRLIDATNWEAFRQWNELAVFWEHWQFHRWNEIKILQIQGALEIPDIVDFSPQFGDTKFLELPLREVFVQVQSNCQFRIEYSQYQPISYTDPFGNVRNGKSDQTDGEKDDGLPKDGIQPKQNSPSDPFANSRPSAGIPTIGNGFFVDPSKLGEEDPANDGRLDRPATANEEGFYLRITWTFAQNGAPKTIILNVGAPKGSVTDLVIFAAGTVEVDGVTLQNWQVRVRFPDGTLVPQGNAFTFLPVDGVEMFGFLPPNQL